MVPQRVSLLAQTVDSLRSGIAHRQWIDYLPPERVLCEQMKISRSTLRRAIAKIEEEGLVDAGGSGKRRQILKCPYLDNTAKPTAAHGTKSIVWLTLRAFSEMPSINLRLIAQLQSRLLPHDCSLNVVRVPEKVLQHPDELMKEWLTSFGGDVWILHQMPSEVQRWFYRNQPTACIVGTRSEGVDLASVEVDSAAALQHAVAMLGRHGHQHITLIRQAQHMVGEDQLEQLLYELCAESGKEADVLACSAQSDMLPGEFEKKFSRASAWRSTALICSVPSVALFALTWLQRQQIQVPEQVSIILLRSQPILSYTSPRMAHYMVNEERAVTQILPRLLDLLKSQVCTTSHINLIPDYVAGETVGPARS
ncbi:substrate-binding domain-containing protein [Verrucomicrobiaceae bacterium N1E253]|uniref:Substrate-binding domain-containing protein n=1 Tax=Oceaniferula marina TaxID=2748318 RepID=A0A851G9W1_9BACT|nr:substrate-binding domain-containing protein [Oceaniferula marina]NWK53999.1 substrate-binding domain-containing protein [Oceaniferula marina]